MNERKTGNFCMILLAFSVLLRTGCALTARAADGAGKMEAETVETRVWKLELLREEASEAAVAGEGLDAGTDRAASRLTFSAEEAEAISIQGGCSYAVDKTALLCQPSTLDFSGEGPKVLIVHTHSSEAYTQETGWEYTESDPLRTETRERSVIRVGDEISEVLESRGIEVLHDTALNDYPTYDGAYARMQTTIESYLAQYPSIQMVLDVHRDAAMDAAGEQVAFTTELDAEACAQIMLVVGTDEGGLAHPQWRENLANALKLQAVLNRNSPGLCRALDLRTERFNQHETSGSLLIEFGSTGNTLREAIRAGRRFAEGLAELIEGID